MMTALLAAVFVPLLQQPLPPSHPPVVASAYVPQRVFDSRRNAFSDFEMMLADLARADVVLVGEQHDDPNTHRLELAILEGLTRRGARVVVALEMFERDVQPALDQYLSGAIAEEQFLAQSRPWPRYASDYRPIIEFARTHNLRVVASNVPRRIATDISKSGLSVLDGLGAERRLAAKDPACPTSGSYYDRFVAAMGGHANATPSFYFAQCIKDETMGESIAEAVRSSAAPVTVLHINGAFHSDFHEGTAASAARRLPARRIAVVSVMPVDDIDAEKRSEEDVKRADYLLLTVSAKQ